MEERVLNYIIFALVAIAALLVIIGAIKILFLGG